MTAVFTPPRSRVSPAPRRLPVFIDFYIHNTILNLKFKKYLEREDCKKWRLQHQLPELFFFYVWQESYTHEIITIWSPKQDQQNDNTSWCIKADWGNLTRPNSEMRRNLCLLREGELNFPSGEPPGRLSLFYEASLQHIYIWASVYRLSRIL